MSVTSEQLAKVVDSGNNLLIINRKLVKCLDEAVKELELQIEENKELRAKLYIQTQTSHDLARIVNRLNIQLRNEKAKKWISFLGFRFPIQ